MRLICSLTIAPSRAARARRPSNRGRASCLVPRAQPLRARREEGAVLGVMRELRRSRGPAKTTLWSPVTVPPRKRRKADVARAPRAGDAIAPARRMGRKLDAAPTRRRLAEKEGRAGRRVDLWRWCISTISMSNSGPSGATACTRPARRLTPRLMLPDRTPPRGTRHALIDGHVGFGLSPVVPTTWTRPRWAAMATLAMVAAGTVKSRIPSASAVIVHRSADNCIPLAGRPASTPASLPNSSDVGASSPPTSTAPGVSEMTCVNARPMAAGPRNDQAHVGHEVIPRSCRIAGAGRSGNGLMCLLMVRRRSCAVSNHEAWLPSFETRARARSSG